MVARCQRASILNPALPEVRQRIVDIIKEIITNYDVDGILLMTISIFQALPMTQPAMVRNMKPMLPQEAQCRLETGAARMSI